MLARNELCLEIEQDAVGGIVELRREISRQAEGGKRIQRERARVGRGQGCVAARHIAARCEDGTYSAAERHSAPDTRARGRRGIDLNDVKRAGVQCQTAGDRQRARSARQPGNKEAAGIYGGRTYGPGAKECGAAIDRRRRGDRAVHDQRAGIHDRRPSIGIDARERHDAAAGLDQTAGAADQPAYCG